jgi:magnesium-transporting ATPase (P-type)
MRRAIKLVKNRQASDFTLGLQGVIIRVMWSLNYCLLVFIAVVGVIQLAALNNNFKGLLFFSQPLFTLAFAIVAIGSALFVFFTWYNFRSLVVEGSQQTGSFVASTLAAIIFSLVGSSLVNYRRFNPGKPGQKGLEALRKSTFFQAIFNRRGEKD